MRLIEPALATAKQQRDFGKVWRRWVPAPAGLSMMRF